MKVNSFISIKLLESKSVLLLEVLRKTSVLILNDIWSFHPIHSMYASQLCNFKNVGDRG